MRTTIFLLTLGLASVAYADFDMSRGFRQDQDYRESLIHGYDIQPDLSEEWIAECGNAHHHCVGGGRYNRGYDSNRDYYSTADAPIMREHH